MTQGWKLLVAWKYGYETWTFLKDNKEPNPVEVAEFSKAKGIDDDLEFVWWVPYTLRKRCVIISIIKSRVIKTMHKYGIEILMSVDHAYKFDAVLS